MLNASTADRLVGVSHTTILSLDFPTLPHTVICLIDIANTERIREIGFFASPSPQEVEVAGNHAFIADSDSGLLVVDVSNPEDPTHVGFYNQAGSLAGIFLAGNLAYMRYVRVLFVLDVSNPENRKDPDLRINGNIRKYHFII